MIPGLALPALQGLTSGPNSPVDISSKSPSASTQRLDLTTVFGGVSADSGGVNFGSKNSTNWLIIGLVIIGGIIIWKKL